MKVFIFIFSILISISTLAKNKIIIASDEWCPFNCAENVAESGYLIELAKLIYEKHEIDVEYRVMSWSRAVHACEIGEVDAVIGGYKEDAPTLIYPSEPMGAIGFNYYAINGSFVVLNSIKDLASYKLGVSADYSYGEAMDAYIQQHAKDKQKIKIAYGEQPLKSNLLFLSKGIVDVVVEAPEVMRLQLNQNSDYLDIVKPVGQAQAPKDIFMGFSPINPNSYYFAEIFSKEMRTLKGSEALAQLKIKYGIAN